MDDARPRTIGHGITAMADLPDDEYQPRHHSGRVSAYPELPKDYYYVTCPCCGCKVWDTLRDIGNALHDHLNRCDMVPQGNQ